MQIPAGTFLDKENQTRRCPCVLLLDTSGSMAGEPIRALNLALPQFRQAIADDSTARNSIELAIITFGGVPQVAQDWTDIDHLTLPVLGSSGGTPLGPALQMGLDMIEARRQFYKQNAVGSYVPWVFILTDGAPDEGPELTAAVSRAQQLQQVGSGGRSPRVIVYACSTNTDPKVMGRLKSITERTYALSGMAFREVFLWLSASLRTISKATLGTPTVLPAEPSQMTLSQAKVITP